jgi:hypothetical protein
MDLDGSRAVGVPKSTDELAYWITEYSPLGSPVPGMRVDSR